MPRFMHQEEPLQTCLQPGRPQWRDPSCRSTSHPRSDWEVFCAKWRSFKAARGVEDRQETDSPVTQLHGCMGIWLVFVQQTRLSDPETLQEQELLKVIRKVTVKPENVWVTRGDLHGMKQEQVNLLQVTLQGLRVKQD